MRLDDGILIKDNHKRLAGGVGAAATRAMQQSRRLAGRRRSRERSTSWTRCSRPACRASCSTTSRTYDIREAVKRVNGRAEIEISGGVTLERIPELATTGAHYVSIGALTHSAPAADLSFELEPAE